MDDMLKYARRNFEDLLEKYQALLTENKNLKEELKNLKERFRFLENQTVPEQDAGVLPPDSDYLAEGPLPPAIACENEDQSSLSKVNNLSDPKDKIELFMTLFNGRNDVFAKR